METTGVSAQRTVGEIVAELVRGGAKAVNMDYREGKVSGLRWMMPVGGRDVLFDMPVRIEPVFKMLEARAKRPRADFRENATRDAERIAWRQLLRWVQAQNAMIDTGMVEAAEVYLPYRVVNASGETVFRWLTDNRLKMLEAPK
jgi:hypothetical protein